MKLKIYLWLVLWLTVCNSYASVTWKVWNTDYRVDTTFHAKIGPGTTQTSLLLTGPDTTLTVFYLTVDLTDPYVDIRTVCATDHLAGAQTVTQMAESHSVEGESFYFAGINGGFFAMSGTANDGKPVLSVGRIMRRSPKVKFIGHLHRRYAVILELRPIKYRTLAMLRSILPGRLLRLPIRMRYRE